jgi:hypothetical protein
LHARSMPWAFAKWRDMNRWQAFDTWADLRDQQFRTARGQRLA